MRVIQAGIFGGIVLFLWGAFSWMVLSWHHNTLNQWTNNQTVLETIQSNTPHSGIYLFPSQKEMSTAPTAMPGTMIFASIQKEKAPVSMIIPMLVSLLTQIVAASMVAWMLFRTSNLGFFSCVSFVTIFGIAAGLVTHIPYMNWFGFDRYFTAIQLADLVIGWYFAGLVIAAFYRKDKAHR